MKGIKLLGGRILKNSRANNLQNKVNFSTVDNLSILHKDIKFKSICNIKSLRKNLYMFLKRNKINSKYLYIRLQAKLDEKMYRSFGDGYVIELGNKQDLKMYFKHLETKLAFMYDEYIVQNIEEVRILYGESTVAKYNDFLSRNKAHVELDKQKEVIKSLKLPKNINYSKWGLENTLTLIVSYISSVKFNSSISNIVIEESSNKNRVIVQMKDKHIYILEDIHKDNKLIKRTLIYDNNEHVDNSQIISQNPNDNLDNKIITLTPNDDLDNKDNTSILCENKRNIKIINKKKSSGGIKHITLDLETTSKEGEPVKLICGSIFYFGINPKDYFDYAQALSLDMVKDKENSYTVHLDNNTPYEIAKVKLINQLFDTLFTQCNIKEPMWKDRDGQLKYYLGAKVTRKTVVYIHNGAKFDSPLLLFDLLNTDLYNISCLYRDNKFITLTVVRKSDKAKIVIKDSNMIIPASLDKLSKTFNLDFKKDLFPYHFPNLDNLDYIGDVPDIKYFSDKVTLDLYNEYKSRFNGKWGLRTELEKYCENDCRVLYLVIDEFSKLILNKFNIDIHKFPTLSSIAYNIFKANYLKFSHKQLTQNCV